MEIQFTFFLGLYFVGFLFFVIISVLNIYHLFKYAKGALGTKILLFAYSIVTIGLLALTAFMIKDIDLKQSIIILENNSFNLSNPF